MPEAAFALLTLAAIAAMANWQRSLLICVVIALLQGPLRKLTPDEPAYFVLFVAVVFAAAWLGALLSRVHLGLGRIQGWRKHVGIPFAFFLLLLLLQAVHSLVRWESPAMTGIGLIAYLLPIPSVVLAYQFAIRRGVADVRKLMWFYVVLSGVWLASIYLEYAGVDWVVLGEVGKGLKISEGLETLKAFSGLFRSSEIAAWHTATTACFLFILLYGKRLSPPRMLLTLLLVAALVGVGVLTGRRKMLVQVVIFASVYFFLIAWYLRGAAKVAVVSMAVGVLTFGIIVGTMAPNAGERAFDSYAEKNAPVDLYEIYANRSGGVFGDVAERFRKLGVAPVSWAVESYGWFGAGLGSGSQGTQHVVTHEAIQRGAAEGGLGKITMELGIPGLLVAFWLLFAFVRYVAHLLQALTRISPPHAKFAFGLVAFLSANGATFLVATQAYGDPFVLLNLGWVVGFLLALPVIVSKSAAGKERMSVSGPRSDPAWVREPRLARVET